METVEIVESRLKILLYLSGSLVFVAIAVFLPSEGDQKLALAGWFFGLCSLVFVLLLIRPRTLTLDKNGFCTGGGLFRKPIKMTWRDVTGFFPLRIRLGANMVGFDYSSDTERPAAAGLSRRMSGADGGIGGLWPCSTAALVDQLNAYREAALKAESRAD